MTAENPSILITKTISQILETMYYCSPDYCGRMTVEGEAIGAELGFSGPVCGALRIVAQAGLIERLTADFLGLEPSEIGPEQLKATVRELANVACCSAVAEWNPGHDFHFSIPRDLSGDELRESMQHGFSFDGEPPAFGINLVLRN